MGMKMLIVGAAMCLVMGLYGLFYVSYKIHDTTNYN